MNIRIISILILFCFLGNKISAQKMIFPFRNEILKMDFETAENGILSQLKQDSNNCALNYAAAELYSDKRSDKFNYEKAYFYIKQAKECYNNTKDKTPLLKEGLTASNIDKKTIHITQYALEDAINTNTQDSYSFFLKNYPLASDFQKKIVENKIIVSTFLDNYTPTWEYLKKYVNNNYYHNNLMSHVIDSAYEIATKNPNVEIINYCYNSTKDIAKRDSCIFMMHKIYEECGVYDFTDFWRKYPTANFKDLKEKDERIKNIYKNGDKLWLTIEAAPSRLAYNSLLVLLSQRLKNKDYEGALHKAISFKDYFEGNKDFGALIQTLQQKKDETKIIEKIDNISQIIPIENTTDTTISPDGAIMICALKKRNSKEITPSKNLFYRLRQDDGTWGEEKELPDNINTPFSESSPYLTPDLKALYFVSEGHSTIGGKDIFVSYRIGENWDKWSTPQNLGKEINTEDDEDYFKYSYSGHQAYFTSSKQMYSVTLNPKEQSTIPITVVYGTITDSKNRPVSATISWEDLDNRQVLGQYVTNPKDGNYTICLPSGKNYGYFIYDKAFFPTSGNIDLRGQTKTVKIREDIKVVKIEEVIINGKNIVLHNLFFNTGDTILLPTSIPELNRVSKLIQDRSLIVEISGHTDNVGNDADNQKLSLARAEAVKDYLISLGCNPKRLITVGMGKNNPIASNNTAEGRQQNRRVELRAIK